MIYDFSVVVLHTLLGVVAAAILVLGFAYLIFLGDARARLAYTAGLQRV